MRRTQPTYSSETGCLKSPMSAPNIRYNRRSYRASDRRRQSCVGIYYLPIGIRSPMMSCILQIPSQHTDPMVIISESILLSIVYYQSIGNIPSRFCPMTEYSLDDFRILYPISSRYPAFLTTVLDLGVLRFTRYL